MGKELPFRGFKIVGQAVPHFLVLVPVPSEIAALCTFVGQVSGFHRLCKFLFEPG